MCQEPPAKAGGVNDKWSANAIRWFARKRKAFSAPRKPKVFLGLSMRQKSTKIIYDLRISERTRKCIAFPMLGNPALLHRLKPNGFRAEGFRHMNIFGTILKFLNCLKVCMQTCHQKIHFFL